MKYPCQTVILHTQKRKSLTPVWRFLLLAIGNMLYYVEQALHHPLPLEIHKKYIPGRLNKRDWLSIVSNCAMGSF